MARPWDFLSRSFDPLDAKGAAVWQKARTIPGRNPFYIRADERGNEIHRLAYGDSLSPYGWRTTPEPGAADRSGAIAYLQPADGSRHISLASVVIGLFRGRRSSV